MAWTVTGRASGEIVSAVLASVELILTAYYGAEGESVTMFDCGAKRSGKRTEERMTAQSLSFVVVADIYLRVYFTGYSEYCCMC